MALGQEDLTRSIFRANRYFVGTESDDPAIANGGLGTEITDELLALIGFTGENVIFQGDSEMRVTDAGTGDITAKVDTVDVFSLLAASQRMGVLGDTYTVWQQDGAPDGKISSYIDGSLRLSQSAAETIIGDEFGVLGQYAFPGLRGGCQKKLGIFRCFPGH